MPTEKPAASKRKASAAPLDFTEEHVKLLREGKGAEVFRSVLASTAKAEPGQGPKAKSRSKGQR